MEALRRYIDRAKITPTEFSRRLGVSQPTIWNLLNGKRSASADLIRRICNETGLSADELLCVKTPRSRSRNRPHNHAA